MDRAAYADGMSWAQTLALLAEKIPADEMLAAIASCEARAPIVDPTLYRLGSARLEIVQRYLQATARWQVSARAYLTEWQRTEPAAARARESLRRDAGHHPGLAAGAEPTTEIPGSPGDAEQA